MKISACPICGSKNINAGTLDSGVTFGVTSWKSVCKECGYQGEPLLFDSEQEYSKFLEELKDEKPQTEQTDLNEERPMDTSEEELSELSQKDKEVVELLKEYDKEKPGVTVWPKNKKWWPEILIALGIAALGYYEGFSIAAYVGLELAFIYGILNFIINFVFCLFIIVIVEYLVYLLYRLIK
jgi:transcription elongation factor Elf1